MLSGPPQLNMLGNENARTQGQQQTALIGSIRSRTPPRLEESENFVTRTEAVNAAVRVSGEFGATRDAMQQLGEAVHHTQAATRSFGGGRVERAQGRSERGHAPRRRAEAAVDF